MALKEFLCVVPDHEGVLARRLEVRQEHIKSVPAKVDAGIVTMAGAWLAKHPEEGENLNFNGSIFCLMAESEEDALNILKDDIYTKHGVWDLSKVQIFPFLCASRVAKEHA